MSIVLDWHKKLGYRHDPFADEPTKNIVGMDAIQSKINLFLLKGEQLAIIRGEEGMGKTSFVEWTRKELKFKRKIHAIDLRKVTSREKLEMFIDDMTTPFYKQLLKDERTKEERLAQMHESLKKKPYLLVFEDAHLLNKTQIALLNELMDKSKLQVILVDVPENIRKNPLSAPASVSTSIPKYKDKELEEMLKRRIEGAGSVGIFPFDTRSFHSIVAKAKSNPRKVLQLAKDKAMELSLKNPTLPEVKKEGKEKKEKKDKAFSLFGKIKFEVSEETDEKENKEEVPEAPKTKEKKKDKKEEPEELSEDAVIDAELLKKIVEGK